MLKPIREIAHNIGMQNQYLYRYVLDGDIDGVTNPPSHDYHSEKAMVNLESLLVWIHTRYPNYWGKEHYESAVTFVQQQLSVESSDSTLPKGNVR
jgi:hypothetical protein